MTKKKWIILISIIAGLAIIGFAVYRYFTYDSCVSECKAYRSDLQCAYMHSCEHVCIFSPDEYSCN